MSSSINAASARIAALNDTRINRSQLKIMFIAGMGFFTDAYDLFVIGIAVAILKDQWHLSIAEVSLLSSATLAASAFGAIIFGRIADIFGRKRLYGYEVMILAIGAIATAFAPNIVWLIIFRVVVGIGVGGDYPVSATIMSEYAGSRTRGKLVGLVFSMQAAGLIVGPLIAVILLSTGVSHDLSWRLLLGVGAIPGIAVFYLRRRIRETPRFALACGAATEAAAAVAEVTDAPSPTGMGGTRPRNRQRLTESWGILVRNPTLLKWLIGAAGAWFMLDFAYYGNTIASPAIVGLLSPNAGLVHATLITLVIFVCAAAPGYVVAIWLIDRIGRRRMQIQGFALMALMFGLIAVVPGVASAAAPFVVLFGISYFFTEFGPNTTTFVYPAEIFPVEARTSGHGISAGCGKLGAFVGTYLFPMMLASWGIRGAEAIAGATAVLGLGLTLALLPEPNGKSLEQLSEEAGQPAAAVAPTPIAA